jgi:uncharacterized MnhB-related membrane protein
MFYNKKWIFFIVLYVLSLALYYFVDRQLLLAGIMNGMMNGLHKGPFIILTAIAVSCAIVSSLLSLFVFLGAKITALMSKKISQISFFKINWAFFTALCYIAAAFIFFEMIKY